MTFKEWSTTPPKGWNSWDCYGASVTEEEVRANALYMSEKLKKYGWEYIVVDIQWYEPSADSSQYHPFVPLEMDEFSRLMPSVRRFPSAKGKKGFKPLADDIHRLGLKFGIHIMRGIPRQAVHNNTGLLGTQITARTIASTNSICPWNTDMYGVDASKEGAQLYYNSLMDLYADWGVDFIKVDDIAASTLYGMHKEEIELIRKAIDQTKRPMLLSLSPGPAALKNGAFLLENANMWRLTDDFWDSWNSLSGMFERCERWAPFTRKGNWPDCDMLPLGHIGIRSVDGDGADRQTRFSKAEQRTMVSLWSIFRSPLIFGGELRDNDVWTNSLLTNIEVNKMHDNIFESKQIYRKNGIVVWQAESRETRYFAIFNIDEKTNFVPKEVFQKELKGNEFIDLWEPQKKLTEKTKIVKHDVKLIKMAKEKAE